jgi:hypothetical protein
VTAAADAPSLENAQGAPRRASMPDAPDGLFIVIAATNMLSKNISTARSHLSSLLNFSTNLNLWIKEFQYITQANLGR